ncbi:MAG: hypothetical protein Q9166_002098 [cf. Caloplaca sp. 2 TL-2023]
MQKGVLEKRSRQYSVVPGKSDAEETVDEDEDEDKDEDKDEDEGEGEDEDEDEAENNIEDEAESDTEDEAEGDNKDEEEQQTIVEQRQNLRQPSPGLKLFSNMLKIWSGSHDQSDGSECLRDHATGGKGDRYDDLSVIKPIS